MKTITYIPDGFLIGSTTNSAQTIGFTECGFTNKSNWSYWFEKDKNAFYKCQDIKNKGWENVIHDIQLAKKLNFNVLKTSIEWSRLMPNGEDVSQSVVDHYNKMINKMIELGIKPMIALNHFDMPLWAYKKDGWLNRNVIKKFVHFTKVCFKLFGDRVKTWFTFTEPIVICVAGYLQKTHLPLLVDFQKCYQVQHNILVAHSYVVEEFRKINIKDAEIGIALNILPTIPKDENNKKDLLAAKYADELLHNCFLEPLIHDYYSDFFLEIFETKKIKIKRTKEDKRIIMNNKIDFLGINYYNPTRVQKPKNKNANIITLKTFFDLYSLSNARMNKSRGWEIYPKGLYLVLNDIRKNYNNIKTYITENGMGIHNEEKYMKNGKVIDDYRIQFLSEHMMEMFKAIEEGANCHGFLMWTYIDNWSWKNAYKNRYGFYRLNLETSERKEKKSASWIKKVIANRKLEFNFKEEYGL